MNDLPTIETRMKAIISEDQIERKMMARDDVLAMFEARNEPYKKEIVEDTLPEQDFFPIYHQVGTDFVDLCRGPHIPNLDRIRCSSSPSSRKPTGGATKTIEC